MQEVKNEKFLKKLRSHIRKLRIERNMSQLDLAMKINNYPMQTKRLERGELNVLYPAFIAERLDVKLHERYEFD